MAMFCSDIDGTLLNPERTLSARTATTIKAVLSAGHDFVLCSSRMPESMRLLQDLYDGRDLPVIAYNGALVYNDSGSVIIDNPIAADASELIGETCRSIDLHASFYCGTEWYAWGDDKWTAREANNTAVQPVAMTTTDYLDRGLVTKSPPHKIMCMGDESGIDQLEELVNETTGVVGYRSKTTYLEIASETCSKGMALLTLAKAMNVKPEDITFFGDNFNDLPAFEVVGTSVAVANARDEVLAAADHVTARHHDDGVAAYLDDKL